MLGIDLFVLVVLGLNPPELVVHSSVDVIEMNSYYDRDGKLVFRQLIFWERRYIRHKPECWVGPWQPWQDVVVAWRIVYKWPQAYRRAGRWRMTWMDDDRTTKTLRTVTSASVIQTWTQVDPEVVNRKILSKSRRRGL